MSHLKDQMRKYAGLDLEDPLGQGMWKFRFVTNSWASIARKLQKLENWKNRSIEELLGGTKGICKERGRKTKPKGKDFVIHDFNRLIVEGQISVLSDSRLIGKGQTNTYWTSTSLASLFGV
jgi:hypothetical protein